MGEVPLHPLIIVPFAAPVLNTLSLNHSFLRVPRQGLSATAAPFLYVETALEITIFNGARDPAQPTLFWIGRNFAT
jgi:hypothetical protein